MERPATLRAKKVTAEEEKAMLTRRNALKNVAFDLVLKVREEKRRPKLSTILSMFRDKEAPEEKAKFLARIKKIY